MIIYDCEIARAIPPREGGQYEHGIEYCGGWDDFANMGISIIGVYDYVQKRSRVFLEDNFDEFQDLVDKRTLVAGYNSLSFDNQLCLANGIVIPPDKSWDILVDIWRAAGLGPKFVYPTHAGYGLDAVSRANGFGEKSGYGGTAPIDWQKGRRGKVIDYCLHDISLTKRIFDRRTIIDPVTKKTLSIGDYHVRENKKAPDAGQKASG